ncbi:MAG TPA: hypothetical protein VI855_09915 [Dehalococcoidia bacterium]|nr:hypothetical protein [Dehalococcoidia bacterium]
MEGIRYVINDQGEKTAVLIDLEQHRQLWEDFCDVMLARQRAEEPRESLESVRKKLRKERRLDG